MLYAGKYDSYLFQIVASNTGTIRVSIFREYGDGGLGDFFTAATLNTSSTKDIDTHLLATGSIDGALNIKYFAGDKSILRSSLVLLSKSELWGKVLKAEYYIGTQTLEGHTVDSMICNTAIVKAGKFRNVDYQTLAQRVSSVSKMMSEDQDFSSMQKAMYTSRLKTLSDMIEDGYDLSWYIDGYGNYKKNYRLVTTKDQLDEVIKELSNPEVVYVGVDTEFSSLETNWQVKTPARIFGMSLSWEDDQAVYIVFESSKMDSLNPNSELGRIIDILKTKKVISHNSSSEIKICLQYDKFLRVDYDTLLIECNINLNYADGARDLKSLSRLYFGAETLELEDLFSGRVIADMIPELEPEIIKVYGCSDADYCRKLFFRQQEDIDVNSPRCLLDYKIKEMLAIAEYYGTKLDTKLLKQLRECNLEDLNRVEFIARKFLSEVGVRTQAASYLDGKELSEEELAKVLEDDGFREDMMELFSKDSKSKTRQKLTLKSPDDKKILYTILEYPVTRRTKKTKAVSADSDALNDLLVHTTNKPIKFLKSDVISCIAGTDAAKGLKAKELVLLSKNKMDSYKYPFAYLLSEYRSLDKKETSFFVPMIDENANGWLYTNYSMETARTARVTSKIQTLAGPLKKLVTKFSDMYYYVVFDFCQIEFRVMIGIANQTWKAMCRNLMASEDPSIRKRGEELYKQNFDKLVERLNNPDADYHREGGAAIIGVEPGKMTKEQRSLVKPLHFAIPYGAEAYSLAKEDIRHAKTEEEKQRAIESKENLLRSWRKNMFPLYWFLEGCRKQALERVPDEQLPWKMKGRNVGRVANQFGRIRYFDLTPRMPTEEEIIEYMDLSGCGYNEAFDYMKRKIHQLMLFKIKREAGNFPIQSLARDIFFTGMIRLYEAMKKEHMTAETRDFFKTLMSVFVHDEAGIQVHRSVHPFKMYAMILDNCLIELKNHPKYFMNISVADNWSEGKSERFEASMQFAEECAAKYKSNPEFYDDQAYKITNQKEFVYACMVNHFRRRFVKEFGEALVEHNYDMNKTIEEFPVYYLMQRLDMYCEKLDEAGDDTIERIRLCFADKCFDDSVIICGKTPSHLRAEFQDRLAQCRVDETMYLSDEDVIPREDINGITDFVAMDSIESLGSISDSIDVGDIEAHGDLMQNATLEDLLSADVTFTDEELYSTDGIPEQEDLNDDDRYMEMLDYDESELSSSVINLYFREMGEQFDSEERESLKARVVVFDGRIILLASYVERDCLIKALKLLSNYKIRDGLLVDVMLKDGIHHMGIAVSESSPVERVNRILNGVE